MSYTPTQWINGEEGHQTPINASNLNKIENGITDNSSDIAALQGSMRFMGETNSLPQNPSIGDVYQASIANITSHNKAGDLLVYISGNTWHIIPSGDEHDGTVTEITQGAGIIVNNGASLTRTGEVRLDTSYTANDTRNGLMSSSHFQKLSTLSNVAVTGDWADLDQSTIPLSARRQIRADLNTDSVEDPTQTVVSQHGLKNLFSEKSDVGHTHLIEEISGPDREGGIINPLSYYLAKENDNGIEDVLVEAAPAQHSHGNITSGGYLQKVVEESTVYAKNTILGTDEDGKIINKDTIPSSAIRGYTFYSADGSTSISLEDINSRVGSTTDDGLRGSIKNLNTWVGTDENHGLRKKVADLESSVGTSATTGLRKTVSDNTNKITTHTTKLNKLVFKVSGSQSNDVHRLEATVPANGTKSGKFELGRNSKTGISTDMWPIAIRGWNFSNQESSKKGRNCSACNLYSAWFSSENSKYYFNYEIKNSAATSAIVYLTIYILWSKCSNG